MKIGVLGYFHDADVRACLALKDAGWMGAIGWMCMATVVASSFAVRHARAYKTNRADYTAATVFRFQKPQSVTRHINGKNETSKN